MIVLDGPPKIPVKVMHYVSYMDVYSSIQEHLGEDVAGRFDFYYRIDSINSLKKEVLDSIDSRLYEFLQQQLGLYKLENVKMIG